MRYEDFLQKKNEEVILPYLRNNEVVDLDKRYRVKGKVKEGKWYAFRIKGRDAFPLKEVESELGQYDALKEFQGYLFNDLFISGGITHKAYASEELQLEKFTPVKVKQWFDDSLLYSESLFETNIELEVRIDFEGEKNSIRSIKGVTPDLFLAYTMFSFDRTQKRIEEEEKLKKLEKEEREKEIERQRQTVKGRLEYSLSRTGAKLLNYVEAYDGTLIVRFEYMEERFECVAHKDMRIIDAGICLTDERTGEKGDGRFTVASLPSVISYAKRQGKLVVFRHV